MFTTPVRQKCEVCGIELRDNWVFYMGRYYCRRCFKEKFPKFGTVEGGK